jgi:hypothetical protein
MGGHWGAQAGATQKALCTWVCTSGGEKGGEALHLCLAIMEAEV